MLCVVNCVTSRKVQILTQEALPGPRVHLRKPRVSREEVLRVQGSAGQQAGVLALLALLALLSFMPVKNAEVHE